MRIVLAVVVFALSSILAGAEERREQVIKMLSPEECALITKVSADEFYVKGPITIGVFTLIDQSITRNGFVMNGVDNFDVVNRSCFNGRPS